MPAGPATQITDVVVPEVFSPYIQQLTEEKTRLIQAGVIARDEMLDDLLSGGGLTFETPSYRDLDADDSTGSDRVSTDTSVPFAGPYDSSGATVALPAGQAFEPNPQKIQTDSEIAVRLNRNQSWSSSDLASALAGADPMDAIGQRVSTYWARRLQRIFVAQMNGIIKDNIANDSGDYENDISGASFSDGVTNFSSAAFLDAAVTMGDSQEDLTAVMVHSIVYNRMQKNNLIDFIPDARGETKIPFFLGRQVIVDDGMPRNGSVYDTWLFGAGQMRLGVGSAKVPVETKRDPGAGNGGGQETLYTRNEWCMHFVGHAYTGTASGGGPGNGTGANELNNATSWNRVYPERKQIKFARLVTREA